MFELAAPPGKSRRILRFLTFSFLALGALVIFSDRGGGAAIFSLTFFGLVGAPLTFAVIRRLNRMPDASGPDVFLRDGLSTDVINFSRLRVSGVGGLGLVAVAIAMAISLPFVGVSLAVAVIGGIGLSFVVRNYRRQHAGRWG
jgi:hypothetical protein